MQQLSYAAWEQCVCRGAGAVVVSGCDNSGSGCSTPPQHRLLPALGPIRFVASHVVSSPCPIAVFLVLVASLSCTVHHAHCWIRLIVCKRRGYKLLFAACSVPLSVHSSGPRLLEPRVTAQLPPRRRAPRGAAVRRCADAANAPCEDEDRRRGVGTSYEARCVGDLAPRSCLLAAVVDQWMRSWRVCGRPGRDNGQEDSAPHAPGPAREQ